MMCYGENDRWYLVGQFHSYSGSCGNQKGQFTRTSTSIGWVEDILKRLHGKLTRICIT